jgi:PTH1 family peptidyl-tRNA hydrolase
MVVEALAAHWGAARLELDVDAEVLAVPAGFVDPAGPVRALWLVKPLTYMNLSGEALEQLRNVRPFRPEELLVVVDDIYLPFGKLRLRKGGADGGHNGLTSLHASLGTLEVPRLRCGVGPVPAGVDLKEFVLESFAPGERDQLTGFIDRAARVVREVLDKGVAAAQNAVALANEEGVEDA